MSLVRAGYARTGINQIRSSKKNTGRKVPVGDLVSLYGAARIVDGELVAARGATNIVNCPLFNGGVYSGNPGEYNIVNATGSEKSIDDHPLEAYTGIDKIYEGTRSGSGTYPYLYYQDNSIDDGELYTFVVIRRRKPGSAGTVNKAAQFIFWYDSGGFQGYSQSPYDMVLPDDGAWRIEIIQVAAPTGAIAAQFSAHIGDSTGSGEVIEYAYFGIFKNYAGWYDFDNATIDSTTPGGTYTREVWDPKKHLHWVVAGSMGDGHSWSSTAHASSSVRASSEVNLSGLISKVDGDRGAILFQYRDFMSDDLDGSREDRRSLIYLDDSGSSAIHLQRYDGSTYSGPYTFLQITGPLAGSVFAATAEPIDIGEPTTRILNWTTVEGRFYKDSVGSYGTRTSYTPGDFVPTKFNIGHANGSAPAHVSFKNFMLFNTQLSREDQLFNQKMLEHGVFDLSKYRGNPIALIDFSKPDALLAA